VSRARPPCLVRQYTPTSTDHVSPDEGIEDKKDTWYNLLSDSEDKDDNSIIPSFTLPLYPSPSTSIAFIIPEIIYKEYLTSTRIKAIYILE
jgi:hypothetical protein